MINNFQDTWLRDFFENDINYKKIPASIRGSLFRKLVTIQVFAKSLQRPRSVTVQQCSRCAESGWRVYSPSMWVGLITCRWGATE